MVKQAFRKFDNALVATGRQGLTAELASPRPASETSALLAAISPRPHADIVSWFEMHNGGSSSSTRWHLLSLQEAIDHREQELAREHHVFAPEYFPFAIDSIETFVVDTSTGKVLHIDLVTGLRELAPSLADWLRAEATRLDVDLTMGETRPSAATSTQSTWFPPNGGQIERVIPFDGYSVLAVVRKESGDTLHRVSAIDRSSAAVYRSGDEPLDDVSPQPVPLMNHPWDGLVAVSGREMIKLGQRFGPPERLVQLPKSAEPQTVSWSTLPWFALQSNGAEAGLLLDIRSGDTSAVASGARFFGKGFGWIDDAETLRFSRVDGEIETLSASALGLPGFGREPLIDNYGESFVVASPGDATGFVLVQFRDRMANERSRVDACTELSRPFHVVQSRVMTTSRHDDHVQNHWWNFFQNTQTPIGEPQPLEAPQAVLGHSLSHHVMNDDGTLAIENAAYRGTLPGYTPERFSLRATLDDGQRFPVHPVQGQTIYDDIDEAGRRALFSRAWRSDTSLQISRGEVTTPVEKNRTHRTCLWETVDGVEARHVDSGRTKSIAAATPSDCQFVGDIAVVVHQPEHLTFVSLGS